MKSHFFRTFSLALSGIFACAAPAFAAEPPAQPSPAYTMPTVTVTAQKREENVQEVPASVGVIDDRAIEERNIREFRDLSGMSPNLNITTAGGPVTYTYLGMRGRINSNSDMDPTVTVVVDGVPYDDYFTMSALPLFDIERVEVLRGPQSTMYGMNSEAGVINIVTKQPGKTLRALLGANIGTGFGRAKEGGGVRGSLSGPVVEDVLSLGLAFNAVRGGSYIDNMSDSGPSRLGETNTGAFRLSAAFTPSDIFDARLNFGYSRIEAENGYIGLPIDNATARAIGQDRREKWRADIDFDEDGHVETLYGDLHMRLKTSLADVVSVTSLRHAEQKFETDFDLGGVVSPYYPPGTGMAGIMENKMHSFTQELRVQSPKDGDSPFEWLAGAFYHNFEREMDASNPMTMFGTIVPGSDVPMMKGTLAGNSFALFGQGTYRLFDKKLGLTVGLRHEWTEREFEDDLYFTDGKIRESDTQLLPRFSVDYRITPENMVYASAAMGWRPGGVLNTVVPMPAYGVNPTKDDLRYDKETSWTYELGTKNEFFDKRLTLNAAVFYSVYSDYQDRYMQGPYETYLRNAGEARMAGFEVEAQARIADSLTADLAFGYVHARYETYTDEWGNDFSGNTVAAVPEFNGSLAVKYSFLDGFYVRPEVRLTGATYWDRTNEHKQDPYATLHARIGYAADNWEIYVYGDNLTNEYAFTMAQPFNYGDNSLFGAPIRPLEIGVGFNLSF
ncbi:MAG: TonB-dependent receptor [Desulfovibrio sp.]|jgi:iron complex outermembrane receptor protein|nr:TonB-dependent receptor [Desulfovibrio sp.]